MSKNIQFQEYPSIVNSGSIKIGKNVWLDKNISFKVMTGGVLEIADGAIISWDCSFSVRTNGNIKVGSCARINSGAIIVGDVHIANDVIVAPNVVMISDSHRLAVEGLSIDEADAAEGMKIGTITIQEHAFVGVGAIILHNVNIGRGSIIGAQTLVVRDVGNKEVIVGSKAVTIIPQKVTN